MVGNWRPKSKSNVFDQQVACSSRTGSIFDTMAWKCKKKACPQSEATHEPRRFPPHLERSANSDKSQKYFIRSHGTTCIYKTLLPALRECVGFYHASLE
jgi:hypothetical protein